MTLKSGDHLGPYEIQSPLGAGGMGEVYRARDTRLQRDVAIKVLPESLAVDPDRLRRFEQEARTVAALNHPNILAVFDIGVHEGSPYMVSELLDGTTLREKLQQGPLPQRRALEYAAPIAEGLAAAHDKGVIHRDLKPENLFVTRDGRVKILDFGLAKLARANVAAGSDGATATVAAHTAPGMVLGTVGYMSPEQVRGIDVDERTDIFALGAILYEMLSGQRAFHGDSAVETMNAILKEEPPELPTEKLKISPGLEKIVRRCLEKEPARRFHSARDVGFALEAVSGTSVASDLSRRVAASNPRRWVRYAAIVLVLLAAATAAYLIGIRSVSPSPTYQQLTMEPGYAGPARFTRDGHTVVYSAAWNGASKQLYSQRNNSVQGTPLNLDADVLGIAENGDMAVILKRHFLATWLERGTLARMPLEGGGPRPILENVYEADITRDGKEFAIVRSFGGKQRLEFPIGKVLYESAGWMHDVRISPDGQYVAFADHPLVPDDRGDIVIVDMKGTAKHLTPVYATARSLCWKPDGREIWYTASRGNEEPGLFAVNFAGKIRTVLHTPTELVIEDIAGNGDVLLESVRFQIEMGFKRAGETRAHAAETSVDLGAMSLDGEWLVFNRFQGSDYQANLRKTADGASAVQLGEGYGAGMTPNNDMVAATRNADQHKLYLYPTGAGEPRIVDLGELSTAFGTWENDVTFSRDGHWAMFAAYDGKHDIHDYLMDMRDNKLRAVTPAAFASGKLSPDGTRFATLDITAQKWMLADLASGKMTEMPGLEADERVLGWNLDNASVVVWNQELPARISLLQVDTGKRQLVQTIEPLSMQGSMYARMVTSADGKTAAYRHRRGLYAIYIAEGLR